MFLIFISLMNNDIEILFMAEFTICISSLVKGLFKYFIQFVIGLFLSLLSFKCSAGILDTVPWSDM